MVKYSHPPQQGHTLYRVALETIKLIGEMALWQKFKFSDLNA